MKNLKLSFLLPFLFLSAVIASGQTQKENKNPYNLKLINTTSEYKNLVANNPQMEMMDIEKAIKNIVLDIRYATDNNFTGEVIYEAPRAFARKPVVEALKQVQDSLVFFNLGLKIYDAYRPYAATLKFYEVYPDTTFVANPKYGSRHNRGCAIDLSLVDLKTGKEIPMPSVFDDFSEKAHPDFMDFPEELIKNRTFLFEIMAHFGFTHYASEWWHFDYVGWENFPLMDLSFEELEK